MPARRFTDEEESRLRLEYETDWDETWEIADRWGISLKALHMMATTRGWRRPKGGILHTKLAEGSPLREQVETMWKGDISCTEIGRFLGVAGENARKACVRAFGDRNLHLNHNTYMVKRNRQIHRMRYMGAAVEDLAHAFRLSEITIRYIIRKLDGKRRRKSGGFWKGRKVKPFDQVRRDYNQKYTSEDYEQHEAFLRDLLLKASVYFGIPAHMILWDTRGRPEQFRARQIVSYILHCEVGLTMQRVGELIGRSYSTVSHSARKIEDERDDLEFDETIQELAELFLDHLKKDMAFTSPYELYFSTKGKEDGMDTQLVHPGKGIRIQSRGKLGGRRGPGRYGKAGKDARGQLPGERVPEAR